MVGTFLAIPPIATGTGQSIGTLLFRSDHKTALLHLIQQFRWVAPPLARLAGDVLGPRIIPVGEVFLSISL